jgi:hypothetical protein
VGPQSIPGRSSAGGRESLWNLCGPLDDRLTPPCLHTQQPAMAATAAAGRITAVLLLLLLVLVLSPPVAAQQRQQQQKQQQGATIESLYRFPLCLQGDGGGGCLDHAADAVAATGADGAGLGGSGALSAPGAGAVLSVAWDPSREGYVLRAEGRKGKAGQEEEAAAAGWVRLANATALEGAF